MHRGIASLLVGLLAGTVLGGAGLVFALNDERAPATVKVCVGKRSAVVSATKAGKCPPGSKLTRINKQGPAGPPGTPGVNGTNGVDGTDGADGANGTDGVDGVDGVDGTLVPDPTVVIDGGTP